MGRLYKEKQENHIIACIHYHILREYANLQEKINHTMTDSSKLIISLKVIIIQLSVLEDHFIVVNLLDILV